MRFLQICWKLSKYAIFYKLTRHRHENFGWRLKLAFEELGLTFIKIGQILSLRYDILSRDNCESLQALLDRVNPIGFEVILGILETEYKQPPELVFKKIDPVPLGSASVSQVHKTELFDGSLVAVKVKRPGADRQFKNDINILKRLAFVAERISPTLRHVQARELVGFFEGWLRQDLDFVAEVRNMKRIYEQYSFGQTNFRSDLGKGIFPLPHEEFCTENIIVMDYIDGIPMSNKVEILAHKEYDVEKSIKTYVNAAIRNWFREDKATYLFQGDPHLSNILVLPHGDVANVDYGLISELSFKEAKQCQNLILAVYLQDLEKVLHVAAEMTGVEYKKYAPILRPDIEKYLKKSRDEGLGFWFLEFVKILVKYRVKFPLYLTTFGRTNLMLDGLVRTYLPEKNTLDIVGGELKRKALQEIAKSFFEINWIQLAYSLGEKVQKAPKILADFINNPLIIISEVAKAVRTKT